MKRNIFCLGMLVTVLAFGMTVVGCDDGSGNGNGNGEQNFTVTFDLDGGNISGSTASVQRPVKSGGTVIGLPNPQKADNTFDGWFSAKNGAGTAFTATTTVTAHLVVMVTN